MGGGRNIVVIVISVSLILVFDNVSADQKSAGCGEVNATIANKSPTQLLTELTHPCRYDRWSRPPTLYKTPLRVRSRVYVYFLGSIEAQTLQFSAHIIVRFRWKDDRLAYSKIAPSIPRLLGEKPLRDRVWVPHVYLVNEHESHVMGSDREDIVITILPDGTTLFSTRIKVTMLCIMNLQKFPFDQQVCPMVFESWSYNATDMILEWESDNPVTLNDDMHLTEYSLADLWTNATEHEYRIRHDEDAAADFDDDDTSFVGNYSRLLVAFSLRREVGHYIMDYYVPSILLVVVSWVSFWLDPNAVPGRTTLGTSTMLTFITLTRNTGSPLPKVSYIKATEIWFMVCTAFIFGSLVEFAFVNTIWRRKNNVELKKVNSKYIFKSTLTPTLHRKQLANSLERCRSCPDIPDENGSTGSLRRKNNRSSVISGYSNQLTVTSMDSICREPFPSTFSIQDGAECQDVVLPVPRSGAETKTEQRTPTGFTTMTPQQIAQWIDRRSRVVFPLSFVVFNVLYWGFVWM